MSQAHQKRKQLWECFRPKSSRQKHGDRVLMIKPQSENAGSSSSFSGSAGTTTGSVEEGERESATYVTNQILSTQLHSKLVISSLMTFSKSLLHMLRNTPGALGPSIFFGRNLVSDSERSRIDGARFIVSVMDTDELCVCVCVMDSNNFFLDHQLLSSESVVSIDFLNSAVSASIFLPPSNKIHEGGSASSRRNHNRSITLLSKHPFLPAHTTHMSHGYEFGDMDDGVNWEHMVPEVSQHHGMPGQRPRPRVKTEEELALEELEQMNLNGGFIMTFPLPENAARLPGTGSRPRPRPEDRRAGGGGGRAGGTVRSSLEEELRSGPARNPVSGRRVRRARPVVEAGGYCPGMGKNDIFFWISILQIVGTLGASFVLLLVGFILSLKRRLYRGGRRQARHRQQHTEQQQVKQQQQQQQQQHDNARSHVSVWTSWWQHSSERRRPRLWYVGWVFVFIRHACISSEIFQYPRVVFSLPCSPSLAHTLHLHQENCQIFVHYCEQRLVFFKKKKV